MVLMPRSVVFSPGASMLRHEDNTSLTITVHQEGGEIRGPDRLRFTKIGQEKLSSALWGVASAFF
jgi:hypothetical protein